MRIDEREEAEKPEPQPLVDEGETELNYGDLARIYGLH